MAAGERSLAADLARRCSRRLRTGVLLSLSLRVVLLDEFCEYLQAAEVAAHTAIGRALAEDEEGGAANPAKKAKPAVTLKRASTRGPSMLSPSAH
jgi:hypothetical protein